MSDKLSGRISAILFDIDGTLTDNAQRFRAVAGEMPAGILSGDSTGIRMYPEVPATIRALHAAGYDLYTATTNAQSVALQKLALGGLCSGDGSPFFKGLLGGDELSVGGKTSPRFYLDLLAHYDLDPARVMHVGDHPVMDVAHAREAGIAHVVQINREQTESIRRLPEGGFSINRLDLLQELLEQNEMAGADA